MKPFAPDPTLEPLRELFREEVIGIPGWVELAGVEPNTVNVWRYRSTQQPREHSMHCMPKELLNVAGTPLWLRSDAIAWLKHTGRMSEE